VNEGGSHRDYKILTGLHRVDAGRMFLMVGVSRTRGHRTEMRRHFFTQRVVSLWNSSPQEVVDAKILNVFKRRLHTALGVNGIKGYGGKAGLDYLVG